ncbi:MAG TPA: glycosyltransferase family 2 protein [Miltoncostaeales bacterium]|nr:glycosyltransferase family 2 protein [Miltoncostaeales bacterium]
MIERPQFESVAVAICTFRRPVQLAALLPSLAARLIEEASDLAATIVVIDDCPDGSAQQIVADSLITSATVEYHNTASGNVSIARNAAIHHAVASDLVVCIDDDCLPEPGWFAELRRVCESTGAEIVTGHHEFVAPAGAPSWLTSQPFLHDHGHFEDASDPGTGNMANLLIRSDFLLRTGLRFRVGLGRTGGEDMVFFSDARRSGAVVRHAALSIVREPFLGHRVSTWYHLYRQLWLGNNEVAINRITATFPVHRLFLRGSRRVVSGLVRPLGRLARRQPPQLRWSVAVAGNGVGLLLGLCRVRLPHW